MCRITGQLSPRLTANGDSTENTCRTPGRRYTGGAVRAAGPPRVARAGPRLKQASASSSGISVSSTSGNSSARGWRRASRSSSRPFLTFAMITGPFRCRVDEGVRRGAECFPVLVAQPGQVGPQSQPPGLARSVPRKSGRWLHIEDLVGHPQEREPGALLPRRKLETLRRLRPE